MTPSTNFTHLVYGLWSMVKREYFLFLLLVLKAFGIIFGVIQNKANATDPIMSISVMLVMRCGMNCTLKTHNAPKATQHSVPIKLRQVSHTLQYSRM